MKNKTSLLALALALGLAAPIAPVFAEDAPNYIEEMKRWQPKAEAGDAEAQFQLGQMYALGHGFKQNFNSALEWYEKAAAQGNAKARTALGMFYYYGVGVEKNEEKAGEWFEKAAVQDDILAQFHMGLIAYNARDYTMAKQWWERAAAKDYAPAMKNIGQLYKNGEGVAQDSAKAKYWYEKGVKQKKYSASSMYMLAQLYLDGNGVKKDKEQAIAWLKKSCTLDEPESIHACHKIYNNYFDEELEPVLSQQKIFTHAMKAAKNGSPEGALILRQLKDTGFIFPDADKEQALAFVDKFDNNEYWNRRLVERTLEILQD